MSDVIRGQDVVIVRDGHVALASSTFRVPEAAITAVIGPNGSGKSTLLHAATGLLPLESGTIEVLGKPPVEARGEVAYVVQHMNVNPGIPMTVREVVSMGRYPSTGLLKRLSAADKAQVNDAMALLRIDDLADRQVARLSGGQRQRVFVAQALAQDHRVLFMDEPLTGLDIQSAQTIDDIMHEEPARGCSVVFTTHDLEEARAADHVILVSGYVVADGAPEDVLTPENLATAYGLGLLHPENTAGLGIIDDAHDPHHSHEQDNV
ncbi:MAG: metal ABC transporter ATP-binding protein [Pontimonas sp.]|jgi:manganese transport system ATP-binding protein|nr:metal ABC transporter ATP-binding protein [Pontimonas sp.]